MNETSTFKSSKKLFALLGMATIFCFFSLEYAFGQAAVISTPMASSAAALLEKHESLKSQLARNSYRRPLVFDSAENADTVVSTVYAELDAPFDVVKTAFKSADRWCDVLILHLNTKHCQASPEVVKPARLSVNVGKKTPQPLPDTFLLEFLHRVPAETPDYLAVELHADKGPLNTTDYRLELLAVPLSESKTFITLRYSYTYGLTGKLAMQTYLSTLGRGKVGFSRLNSNRDSPYVGGMRGAVERNTMRYYLAIEAYLASLRQPSIEQVDARLQHWFNATEEYAIQLHEIDRQAYFSMKKSELNR